jgi:Transposase DDE domain
MDADLDSLLTGVFCTADDLLPTRAESARRVVTDAEVVTLAVAQVRLGFRDSDRRFLAAAQRRLGHLFAQLPTQDAYHERRARLEAGIEWLSGIFASQSPGFYDNLLRLDSTPGRDRPLARDRQARRPEHARRRDRRRRRLRLSLLARGLRGGETIIADKGYAGQEFATAARELGATILRPNRKDEPGQAPMISGIRQRIESIINTTKDTLGLERHNARTLHNLRVRICVRLLALAACITHNHQLGLPSRHLTPYTI